MGRSWLSPDAERRRLEQGGSQEDASLKLTLREEKILNLMINGCSDRHIAAQLELSDETARTDGKTVRRKLGVKATSNWSAGPCTWCWGTTAEQTGRPVSPGSGPAGKLEARPCHQRRQTPESWRSGLNRRAP